MTAKPDRKAGTDLDAVAWVRRIRDKMYEETAALSAEELISFVRRAAATTDAAVAVGRSKLSEPPA